jgi:hypothetical protein
MCDLEIVYYIIFFLFEAKRGEKKTKKSHINTQYQKNKPAITINIKKKNSDFCIPLCDGGF